MRRANSDTGFIYTLADPNTGLVRYVGQAVDLKKRVNLHLYYAKNGYLRTHKEKWLGKLLSADQLPIVEVVWEGEYASLNKKEEQFIALFKSFGAPLTNATLGGETTRGRKCSEETKRKFVEMFKGKCLRPPISEKEKKATSMRSKGIKIDPSQILALKEQRKVGSEYWRNNPAAFQNMIKFSEGGKSLSKAIIATKAGVETRYKSTLQASEKTGVDRRDLVRVANGVYNQIKGFTFKFVDNETIQGLSV